MMTGFIYQAVMLVFSFVSKTVFIRTLGDDFLGMNAIFSDVLSLLSMADLGFGTAMAYSFYKPLAEDNKPKIASLIRFYKKIYNSIALIVTVVGVLCIPFLDVIINTEKEIPNLEVYYLFSLAGVVISYMFVYKTTLLDADQKNYKLTTVRMFANLIKTILQVVALVMFHNYIVYLSIGVFIQLVNNFVASAITEKEYPYLKEKQKVTDVDKEVKKNLFGNMKSVFIYKLSITLFTATDNIIMSIVVGTAMTGIYSNYLMVSNKLLLVEQIVFSALTASVGNVIAKESAKKRYEIFSAMQSVSFIFCGVLASSFCIMANDLVNVWLGDHYVLPLLTVIAISINTYFSCALQPLWVYRDATGLYQKTKWVMLVGAVVNIVLSFVLGNAIGLAGIIFASAIARISTYFWYEPKILFREYFDQSAGKYFVSILKNVLLVALTVFAGLSLTRNIAINGWVGLIIEGIIVGSLNMAIFMLAYCKTEGFQMIWKKGKKIIKKDK